MMQQSGRRRWARRPAAAAIGLAVISVAVLLAGCRPSGADAYEAAVEAANQQRWAEAEESFKRALEENPDFAEAHMYLGLSIVNQTFGSEGAGGKPDPKALLARLPEALEHWREAKRLFEAGTFQEIENITDEKKLELVNNYLSTYEPFTQLAGRPATAPAPQTSPAAPAPGDDNAPAPGDDNAPAPADDNAPAPNPAPQTTPSR